MLDIFNLKLLNGGTVYVDYPGGDPLMYIQSCAGSGRRVKIQQR